MLQGVVGGCEGAGHLCVGRAPHVLCLEANIWIQRQWINTVRESVSPSMTDAAWCGWSHVILFSPGTAAHSTVISRRAQPMLDVKSVENRLFMPIFAFQHNHFDKESVHLITAAPFYICCTNSRLTENFYLTIQVAVSIKPILAHRCCTN